MDRRYYVSLVLLGGLVILAWSMAPAIHRKAGSQVAEVADQGAETAAGPDVVETISTSAASPIITKESHPVIAAKVDAAAFSQQVNADPAKSESQNLSSGMDAIPDRQSPSRVPLWSAAFQEKSAADQVSDATSVASGSTMPDPTSKESERQSTAGGTADRQAFSMPNTRKPLTTLPNDRMVLKPIAKLGSPFSPTGSSTTASPQSSTDRQGGGDPLFAISREGQVFDNRPSVSLPDNEQPQPNRLASSPQSFRGRPPAKSSSSAAPGNRGAIGNRSPDHDRDQYIWHVVEAHQSLRSLSIQYRGDASIEEAILRMNRDIISDPELLPVGEAIRIPTR